MTTKLTKNDLKKDVVTQELQKGFVWSTKHVTGIAVFIIAFILLGSGYSVVNYFNNKKEEEAQEAYYLVEKDYLAQKAKFEQFEQEAAKPKADKKTADNKKAPEPEAKPEGIKASGNLAQDYGPVLSGFEQVINKHAGSKAASMASLTLAEIYSKYGDTTKALANLDKIQAGGDLLSLLVLDRKASLKADMGDCKSALAIWDQVLSQKTAKFMSGEVKLKKGLCFETLNDTTQAQAMYTQAKEGEAQSPVAKTAEKYLRLLQTKKN